MKTIITVWIFTILLTTAGSHGDDAYSLETISFPDNVPAEVGAVSFNEAGEFIVALRRSDILIAKPTQDPTKFEWRRFASGLHNACGMIVINNHEVIISQMAELTRIVDTDGDGVADSYQNLNSDWGMSGNYHETNHVTPDGKGGYFVAIGTASHNGPVFYNVRGEYSKTGRRGRNFSAASWKGWVLHVDTTGKMTPWCKGFRMHNGIFRDRDGNLWASDNQGDWRATTPFYHLKKDHFYGHPSSLVWDPEWDQSKDPLKLPAKEIEAMKTPAAVLLPHDIMNRSASEPIQIPDDTFGPYGGQILLPDNNGTRINRLMIEEVDGQFQGACALFWNDNNLRSGNNRVCFSPDKRTLYIGQTSRGWGQPAEGVQRITWTGKPLFDVLKMNLAKKGFQLTFTTPVPDTALNVKNFALKTYRYQDSASYGGDKLDEIKVQVTAVIRINKETIEIQVATLKGGGQVYELHTEVENRDEQKTRSKVFCYTINRLIP